jgi:hypothetical protein
MHMCSLYVCVRIRMSILYVCVRIYIYMYVYVCIYIYITVVNTRVFWLIPGYNTLVLTTVYASVSYCMHIYIYIYICIHTYGTYIHTEMYFGTYTPGTAVTVVMSRQVWHRRMLHTTPIHVWQPEIGECILYVCRFVCMYVRVCICLAARNRWVHTVCMYDCMYVC